MRPRSAALLAAAALALSEVYLRLWDNYHGTCPSGTPVTVSNLTGGTAGTSRYGTVVYGYGKCALHDLRRAIGTTAMTNLLRTYAQAHRYGVSTVPDFKAAAQQAAGGTSLASFWTTHRIDG